MNKSLVSQVLDGAAFPLIMLAVAVSQTKIGPYRKDTLRHGGRVAAELQMGDRVQQNAEQYGSSTPAWSPPATEKSLANKKTAQAK
ncbi:MAG: hypothetical protein WB586_16470 [Chthoniobacterales bacterium]